MHTGSTLSNEKGLYYHLLALDTVEVATKLEDVLLWKSISTADDLQKPLQQKDLLGCPLLQDLQHVVSVSEAQLSRAILFFPKYNWALHCRTCRNQGFSTFTCQCLDWKWKEYFHKRHSLHQVESNAQLDSLIPDQRRGRNLFCYNRQLVL